MDPLAERIRNAREDQGRTVRELAVITNIREPLIVAIENGRYDVLPAVYVKSFIRSVGQALNIDSAEISSLMDVVFDSEHNTSEVLPASVKPVSGRSSRPIQDVANITTTVVNASFDGIKTISGSATSFVSKRLLVLIVIAAVLIVGVGLWKWIEGDDLSEQAIADANAIPELNVEDAISGTPADSLILTAQVIDTVWLTITMDSKNTQQSVYMPGDEPRWSAMKEFQLSLSNAGGVDFYRNGSILKKFGKLGEAVRSIKITRTEVTTSAQAFQAPESIKQGQPNSTAVNPQSTSSKPKPVITAPIAPKLKPAPQKTKSVVAQPAKVTQARQKPVAKTRSNSMPLITPAPRQSVPVMPNAPPREKQKTDD